MYTLDTNAVIYFAQGETKALIKLQSIFSSNDSISISTVSVAELFSVANISQSEKSAIDNILDTLYSVPLDETLARRAGMLRAEYNLKLADSIIAATTLLTNSTLVTRNIKDFKKIPNLKLLKI